MKKRVLGLLFGTAVVVVMILMGIAILGSIKP